MMGSMEDPNAAGGPPTASNGNENLTMLINENPPESTSATSQAAASVGTPAAGNRNVMIGHGGNNLQQQGPPPATPEITTTWGTPNVNESISNPYSEPLLVVQQHARIGDPVEPPARNAPKGQQMTTETAAEQQQPVASVGYPSTPGGTARLPEDESSSILSRLFDPDRKQKPALWTHIKLVAPGPADRPPAGHTKWRSKDAIAAYCLKCKKQFTYTKGTSKTISRHMMAYHGMTSTSGDMADDSETGSGKGLEAPRGSFEPPLKKRKSEAGGKANGKSPSFLILKWLVGSFRPFSIVDDPGLNDFLKVYSSEKLPASIDMYRTAFDQCTKIKQHLKCLSTSFDGFSLGCEKIDMNNSCEETFYRIRATFCTNGFERRSFTLVVKGGQSCASIVRETLTEYDLPFDKIVTVTLKNIPEGEDLLLEGTVQSDYIYDVLHHMDTLVIEAMNQGFVGSLLSKLQQRVAADSHGSFQHRDTAYAKSLSAFCSTVPDVHRLLQKCQANQTDADNQWALTKNEQYMTTVLSLILKPLFDGWTTLSTDRFPTVGLAFPVFRRIQNILENTELKGLSTDMVDQGVVAAMEEFIRSLTTNFSIAFSTILGKGHPLMWTVPLDPRLIHMNGLDDAEKAAVSSALVEYLKQQKLDEGDDVVEVIKVRDTATETTETSNQESSTMGGIFWGEDDQDKGSSTSAETYAQAAVNRYFNTVRSQRRIEDPLEWWKSNQEQFPELSQMAKLWFGASAVVPAMNGDTDNYCGEHFGLIAFLHENINFISDEPFTLEI